MRSWTRRERDHSARSLVDASTNGARRPARRAAMARSRIVRWMTALLLLALRARGFACQRDESLPGKWPLAARSSTAAPTPVAEAAMLAAPVRTAAATAAPVVGIPPLTFVRHDL